MVEQATFETETYQFVDDIAELYDARQEIRQSAVSLLEQRRQTYETTGELTYQPVDALSTAHSVLDAGFRYGEDSEEYAERYEGLLLDCQRLVGEWYRKKRSEYFAPVRQLFDEVKEEFFSHGLSIRQMTENALTPMAGDAEEEARRVNERVEDATPHLVRNLGGAALAGCAIRTISECTDGAIAAYSYDQQHGGAHRGYNGYVPEIQKAMIRDIRLDNETNDRFEEQIALDGRYFTHEIFQIALAEKGVDAKEMDKTQLHGAQLLARVDLIDFAAHMDAVATREWCLGREGKALFMGELVSTNHPRDYQAFKQEALERQASLEGHAETVALFVLDLAEDNYDRTKAPAHVEEFVKDILLTMAKQDIAVAEQMFDADTAQLLRATVCLENQGRFAEAQLIWEEAREKAPGGGFCGAGSCGLEGVMQGSKEEAELRKKLNASDRDTIIKDLERACRCGKKSIVYAFNKSKVNKYCQSCGAFESKVSKKA